MNTFGLAESISSWYGATVMFVIGSMSIYMFALIILRGIFFRKINVDSQKLLNDTQHAILTEDSKMLAELTNARATDAPIRILIANAITNQHLEDTELTELLKVARKRQKARLEKGLSAFGTMSTIAPFVGLLGTVLGIVESFYSLAQSGAAGPNVVGSGVAAALWATAAGLCVAIPAVIAYNVFGGKIKALLLEMETVATELVLLFKVNKNHQGPAHHGAKLAVAR